MNGIVVFPNTITSEGDATALTETGGTSFSVVYKLDPDKTSLSGLSGEYDKNQINQALIDSNGLLFLPAAGRLNGSALFDANITGCYYCCVALAESQGMMLSFSTALVNVASAWDRFRGNTVRLATVVSGLT